jgi:gliding motility-associated-like protein
MQKLYATLLFWLALGAATAQTTFKKAIDPELPALDNTWAFGLCAQAFDDNTLYVGGFWHKGPARDKALLCALDASGNQLWAKTYASDVRNEQISDLARSADGNLLALVQRSNSSNVPLGLMKLSPTGDLIWARNYTSDCRRGGGLLPLADGFLICGAVPLSGGGQAPFALKIDADGNVLWNRVFEGLPGADNTFVGAALGPDGAIYLAGNYDYLLGPRSLLAKISPDGNLLWSFTYNVGQTAVFRDVVALPDGSVFVAGHIFSGETWLLHVDNQGLVQNSTRLGSSGFLDPSNVTLGAGGDVVLSLSGGTLAQVGPDGALRWAYHYNAPDNPQALNLFWATRLPDGGFWATGVESSLPDINYERIPLLRTGPTGRIEGCCNSAVNLESSPVQALRQAVALQTASTAPPQAYTIEVADWAPALRDVCAASSTLFSLSDTLLCPGECLRLELENELPGLRYTFLPPPGSEPDPNQPNTLCFRAEGTYSVGLEISDDICLDTVIFQKLEVKATPDAFPNAFSPNNDGMNDRFLPVFFCPTATMRLRIFNRWGELVFEGENPDQGWDGTHAGQPAPADVYVWALEYEAFREGRLQKIARRGDLTLLR